MVAYQPGNAANIAAAATTSQTSFPSHSGPIALIAARLPASSRPTTPCRMPTPKSNPSSTKNPIHSMVIRMNQNGITPLLSASPPLAPVSHSVLGRRDPLVLAGPGRSGGLGRQFPARVPQHEQQVHHPERQVQQHEYPQA